MGSKYLSKRVINWISEGNHALCCTMIVTLVFVRLTNRRTIPLSGWHRRLFYKERIPRTRPNRVGGGMFNDWATVKAEKGDLPLIWSSRLSLLHVTNILAGQMFRYQRKTHSTKNHRHQRINFCSRCRMLSLTAGSIRSSLVIKNILRQFTR